MDPDVALAELRELAEKPISLDVCDEMQQLFTGLDDWLSKSGFLPADWQRDQRGWSMCTVEHDDWSGPHVRISSCPAGAG
jgi:hypothetical protein